MKRYRGKQKVQPGVYFNLQQVAFKSLAHEGPLSGTEKDEYTRVPTLALLIAGPSYYVFLEGPKTVAIVLFLAGVALADRLIGGRSGLIVATIDSLLYVGFGLAYHFGWITATVVSSLLTNMVTVIMGVDKVGG